MKNDKTIVHELQDLNVPADYYAISIPKLEIIKSIKDQLGKSNVSVRKLAESIGMRHPQIVRVTSGENYNIETLLKILYALDLEIVIREKQKK
ncbi:helix-turn-helix domain-containing protein [Paenibacillus sp. PAMC 26794]|uniref:helix-turn-helix domain-containing protein n=1 Tax=Paenibacillus sp. PAMC 26794 TaxID=1257080 RepID=UPI000380547D|nr:helix-turn-helix domain-containing protein [Paenibacillus sp. PAMC 26794]